MKHLNPIKFLAALAVSAALTAPLCAIGVGHGAIRTNRMERIAMRESMARRAMSRHINMPKRTEMTQSHRRFSVKNAFHRLVGRPPAPPVSKAQVATFDAFLDTHPAIDQSLSKNPSLVTNQAFLASNPAFSTWLKANPETAFELRQNPKGFMQMEQSFDASDHTATAASLGGSNHTGVSATAAFSSRAAASSSSGAKVASTPASGRAASSSTAAAAPSSVSARLGTLAKTITTSSGASVTVVTPSNQARPSATAQGAMAASAKLTRTKNAHAPSAVASQAAFAKGTATKRTSADTEVNKPDMTRGEVVSFHAFLKSHTAIAASLKKDPGLIRSFAYLANHTSLRAWLKAHSQAAEEMNETPRAFVKLASLAPGMNER